MQRLIAALLGAALGLSPPGASSADLVVWWQQGAYPKEDEGLREIIAAFEQGSGKRVELILYPDEELPGKLAAALGEGKPPDFAFSVDISDYISEWAFDDRLVNITDTVGSFSNLFDPDALTWFVLLNEKTEQRALYALPIGRTTNHIHVWKSLLEEAGFTVADIPQQWEAFWSFWCDQVQPAVRRATGHDEIWGVGLNMSGQVSETQFQSFQFLSAYGAEYVMSDGKLVIDDPQVRQRLVKAIDSYAAIYLKGCTPRDSVTWDGYRNNEYFLNQKVVMTPNNSLSIPNALKRDRPDDYYENTATIEWPLGPDGKAFPIRGSFFAAVVFKDGRHVAAAKEFVRFLVAEGWLAHYLDFAGERFLPPMPKLLEAPFWVDPSDPHRMAAVMQIGSRRMPHDYAAVSGDMRYDQVWQEKVWAKAVHRVVAEGISPEQAVDEAIVRIKHILSE